MAGTGPRASIARVDLLDRDDMKAALKARNFGIVFELLRRYQGATQSEIAAATGLTQARVSRLMTDLSIRVAHIDVIERICDGLMIPGIMVGLAPRSWESAGPRTTAEESQEEDPLLRRSMLKLSGTWFTGAVLGAIDNEPEAMTAVLDTTSVSDERLTELVATSQRLGVAAVTLSPEDVLPSALATFRTVRQILRENQRTRQRVSLVRSSARLAVVVGEILFNEGEFAPARSWYSMAEKAALDIGDRYLADIALAGQSYLATYSDDPKGVISVVEPRLGIQSPPSPALAWLWSFKAKAHAWLGDTDDTERCFERAHSILESSPSARIHPGVFSFLPEKLSFYEAAAFAMLGKADAALSASDEALRLYDMSETTEPALVRFERATALLQAGEIDEACKQAIGTVTDPRIYPSITVRKRAVRFNTLADKANTSMARHWRDVLVDLTERPMAAINSNGVLA